MSYNPQNSNGQATMASSAPVVLASDQSKISTQINGGQVVTVTGTAGVLNADGYVGDVSNYNFVSVQITGTWSGTLSFQACNDGVNYTAVQLYNASSSATGGNQTITSNGIYHAPLAEQYFRVRMTSYTSGTATVTVTLKAMQASLHTYGVAAYILARSSGGLPSARIKSAASTNATSLKVSTAGLYGLALSNDSSSKRYIKIYNKATAPTVGTDTPVFTFLIPANGTISVPMTEVAVSAFASGLGYAITGGIADSDTTAIGADEVHGIIWYQ
ncbi:MAG TPA: hypothetical protein VF401_02205 [Candidatus Saccharimonadales bacterium]